MGLSNAIKNKEEYKGFLKLFLQRSIHALSVCLLAFALLPVWTAPAQAGFVVNGTTYNTDSGTKLRSEGQKGAFDPNSIGPGVFGVSYFKQQAPVAAVLDTQYAKIGPSDSASRFVAAIYGDTMSLIRGPDATVNETYIIAGDTIYDTVYLTSDTASRVDTLTYVLSISNFANTRDTIGLIIDTAWSRQGLDTLGRFSYQFFDSSGIAKTGILYGVQSGTASVLLSPNGSETVILRIYTTGTAAADTVRVALRAYANNATGRSPGTSGTEVGAYTGFNSVKYGGNGNAATYIAVDIIEPLIRLAKTDTVFTPISYAADPKDTQRYIPGSMMVHTIWFDNDGNDTVDTVVIEDWIDTRYVRFDSGGLSPFKTVSQIAAAGTNVIRDYGNIFLDSAMPTVGTGYNVTLEYAAGGGTLSALTPSVSPDLVGRIRWTISRSGGVLGADNGDASDTIDSAPTAPTAAGDADRGFVRFAVLVRNADSGSVLSHVGQASAIDYSGASGVFALSHFKRGVPIGTDTRFGQVGPADSVSRIVTNIFGDTMKLISGTAGSINDTYLVAGDTLYDTVFLTSDTVPLNDTVIYVLSIANHTNAFDTIGVIVDTAWLYNTPAETTGRFTYQFFGKTGDTLTGVLSSVQQDTARVGLSANQSGTVSLRIYSTGTAISDSVRVAVRAYANNTTGRKPGGTTEVVSYLGLDNVRYGGSGNAAAVIEVSVVGPLLRYAMADTVFTPVAMENGATDTQRYIPGSLMVRTLYFENDGTDTADTVFAEFWIDTRHELFDSGGLRLGAATQIAAAGTYVINAYGNIFLDSAMPSFATTGFNVQIYYSAGGVPSTPLTPTTPAADVGRLRWVITRSGGVVAANNGDDPASIDAAPTAPTAAGDVDRGHVRFSVMIK